MIVRHPELIEHDDIHQFVSTVVNEIYGGAWSTCPIEVESQDWSDAWIACSGPEIVGVVLTKDEWIDDLVLTHSDRRILGRSGQSGTPVPDPLCAGGTVQRGAKRMAGRRFWRGISGDFCLLLHRPIPSGTA